METRNSAKRKRKTTDRQEASPGKRRSSDAKRKIILRAARKVFSRHPYHAASMRMIAKEAHLDHPLIIYYFPTKAVLFETVMKDLTEEFSSEIPGRFKEINEMSLFEGVSTYLDRAIAFHRKNPEITRIMVLNMAQAVHKPNLIPGYQYIQRVIDLGTDQFKERSPFKMNAQQTNYFIKGMSLLIINLMGAREYHAEIQGLDPASDAYFKWAKEVITFMILPVLNSLELKE